MCIQTKAKKKAGISPRHLREAQLAVAIKIKHPQLENTQQRAVTLTHNHTNALQTPPIRQENGCSLIQIPWETLFTPSLRRAVLEAMKCFSV